MRLNRDAIGKCCGPNWSDATCVWRWPAYRNNSATNGWSIATPNITIRSMGSVWKPGSLLLLVLLLLLLLKYTKLWHIMTIICIILLSMPSGRKATRSVPPGAQGAGGFGKCRCRGIIQSSMSRYPGFNLCSILNPGNPGIRSLWNAMLWETLKHIETARHHLACRNWMKSDEIRWCNTVYWSVLWCKWHQMTSNDDLWLHNLSSQSSPAPSAGARSEGESSCCVRPWHQKWTMPCCEISLSIVIYGFMCIYI